MLTLNDMPATEIRRFLDNAIYGDQSKNTNWSEMIANALLDKNPHRLSDFLSHGKGFNDSTKKAFCLLLQVKPVYTQKGIDEVIAQHCDIALERLLLQRKLRHAKALENNAHDSLVNAFSNGKELVDWVNNLFESGFTKLLTKGNKAYLANDAGAGYHLQRAAIRKYAEVLSSSHELQLKLA